MIRSRVSIYVYGSPLAYRLRVASRVLLTIDFWGKCTTIGVLLPYIFALFAGVNIAPRNFFIGCIPLPQRDTATCLLTIDFWHQPCFYIGVGSDETGTNETGYTMARNRNAKRDRAARAARLAARDAERRARRVERLARNYDVTASCDPAPVASCRCGHLTRVSTPILARIGLYICARCGHYTT
jgi:hypothetical protein